ncbi:Biotin-(acetyl-CoA-carboxylase) synthetase [Giardia duodenalis]|uniref:Biotin-(Acetyl-CoA-carboxylase) synthetase n=1 Tax=Giardia intestinalis TaxID=5741 RepID=V6TDP2_GIAIN|nr:Biotin-(acetyl-CoA-carboxylase) synthetase [Giardia intestinalis]
MERVISVIVGSTKIALVHMEECISTQIVAKEYTYSPNDHIVIFHTWNQTAGYGRTGPWQSAAGNLAATWSFPVHVFSPSSMYLRTSLALLRLFEHYGIASTIKWPNDIIVDGEKCAGFLCEQLCPDRVLIGVGINVAVAPPGTSKAPAFAKHLDPSTQTIDLVGYLTNELLASADIPDSMALELYSQACTTIGRQYQHAQYGPLTVTGVTESCCLVAKIASGKYVVLTDVRSLQDLSPVC